MTIAARDGYDVLQALAAASVAATFFGVLLLIVYALVQTRRLAGALERTRKRLSVDPAVESLRKTANHIESISQTLNDEVTKLSESVSRLSDRLTQASDRMEERIEEFNAFIEVVQREAEGAFVEGAATARGVRAGLGNLGHPSGSRQGGRTAQGDKAAVLQEPPASEAGADEIGAEGQGPAGGSET